MNKFLALIILFSTLTTFATDIFHLSPAALRGIICYENRKHLSPSKVILLSDICYIMIKYANPIDRAIRQDNTREYSVPMSRIVPKNSRNGKDKKPLSKKTFNGNSDHRQHKQCKQRQIDLF